MAVKEVWKTLKKFPKPNYSVILVILLVAASFLIGRLSAQVEYLKGGAGTAAAPTAAPQQPAQQPQAAAVTLDQVKALVDSKNNIAFGDKNKKLIFVEFSDPSCPYCHIAGGKDLELNKYVDEQSGRKQFTVVADGGTYVAPVPEMKKLVDSGKAAFVWLYANGHGNGEMATKALYCAYEKGKFWPVHDLLMSDKGYEMLNGVDIKGQPTTGPVVKNDKTKSSALAEFLKKVMSYNDMKNCLESGKYDNRITDDQALARSMGFSGTPHFFVNTTPFVGAYSFKDMESAVATALK
ncbi:MAG: DsbA family protein [Microgenomates group bacterium]